MDSCDGVRIIVKYLNSPRQSIIYFLFFIQDRISIDFAILSTALNDISMAPTSIDNVIQDTHYSLQAFRRTHIQHVKRIGNKLAHTLAHHAKGIDDYVTWIEEAPPCIEPIVFHDALSV